MLTAEKVKAKAREVGADICGIGDIRYYEGCDPQRDPKMILPSATCVIGFGFRVPRSLYSSMEKKVNFYSYTSMGVKTIDEELSVVFLLQMGSFIENHGYDACLQRNIPNLRIQGDKTTNPEVLDTYELQYAEAVKPDRPVPDVILDFSQSAQICGLGSVSVKGNVLTPQFGPFIRFVYIVTNAPLQPDQPFKEELCDQCEKCANACPGAAIDMGSGLDTWQCSVYYRGAHQSNPLMEDDFLKDYPEREEILQGMKRFDSQSARALYPHLDFLPSRQSGYTPCLCGKPCDIACYQHLKESGRI